ncbi:hypothetical protein BJ912DRAFT_951603 [Pholiota molesta]|nr:hypothetical protein BJ912DRAFT_951603 [Pholiota molesta]
MAFINDVDDEQSGSDMQVESDAEREEVVEEEEEQVDVEAEDDEEEVEDADEDEEVDPDGEGEDEEESENESDEEELPVPTPPVQPRLKITLKLPANTASSNGTDAEADYPAFKRTPKRRAKTKIIQDADIESEDPTSVSDSDEEASVHDIPSHSTGTPTASTKPMTTRQAVLASVVDPSHVSLNEGTRSKKQPLNETELALRREETARKRKNLSEKKLEDEKAETINRLLKKQSRPKNKRTNTLDDRSPMPAKVKPGDDDVEAEYDEDAMDVVEQPEEVKPIMYRWVSSLREVPVEGGERRIEMGITFSVPENVIPQPSDKTAIIPDENQKKIQAARGPGVCAVEGCGKPRKYRLPKDWTIGACDSTHLRILAN